MRQSLGLEVRLTFLPTLIATFLPTLIAVAGTWKLKSDSNHQGVRDRHSASKLDGLGTNFCEEIESLLLSPQSPPR